jgi:hypothetical protein
VLNDVVLNQVLLRFGDDDARTNEVIARVQAGGTAWMGGTTGRDARRCGSASATGDRPSIDIDVARARLEAIARAARG